MLSIFRFYKRGSGLSFHRAIPVGETLLLLLHCHFISGPSLTGFRLCKTSSHPQIKLLLAHFITSNGAVCRDGRSERQPIPQDNLTIEHIDRSRAGIPRLDKIPSAFAFNSGSTRAATFALLIAIALTAFRWFDCSILYVGCKTKYVVIT